MWLSREAAHEARANSHGSTGSGHESLSVGVDVGEDEDEDEDEGVRMERMDGTSDSGRRDRVTGRRGDRARPGRQRAEWRVESGEWSGVEWRRRESEEV
jgi:hypothetical protein